MYESRFGFEATCGAIEIAELSDFEMQVLKTQLPESYRSFLWEWNGGLFQELVGFPFKDSEDELDYSHVGRLSGLFDPSSDFDLRRRSNNYGFHPAVPRSYLSIGDNHSWNQLCISVEGRDRGFIYYWDPGEPWPAERNPTTEFLRPVAKSFAEFWRMLFLPEE